MITSKALLRALVVAQALTIALDLVLAVRRVLAAAEDARHEREALDLARAA